MSLGIQKAKEYAKKIGTNDDKVVLAFMTGFQACEHQSGKLKLDEVRNNFREKGKEVPSQLERAFKEVETLLEKYE